MKLRPLVLVALLATTAHARNFSEGFAFVVIDDATEKKLGPFPYDRAVYAKGVEACARMHAKGVVLKFFFDEPKSPTGDAALAAAMTKIPVLLQARLVASEGTSQPLPARFHYAGGKPKAAISGQLGWIPLPQLLETAAGVGFADFDSPTIPLIERYRGEPFKSIVLSCLELALDASAQVVGNQRIDIGNQSIAVDQKNVFHGTLNRLETLQPLSFSALLEGQVSPDLIAGRVVIIGWDAATTPTLPSTHGPMKIHRLFVQCLAAAWHALAPIAPPTPPAPP